jgi:twinkle protein
MKTFEDYGITNYQSGRTTCPQCSETRQKKYVQCLSVDIEKGAWFCHHCGWSGYLDSNKKYNHEEIKKHFSKPHFVESECDKNAVKWFKERGISESTLKDFKIKTGPAWMHGPNGGGEVNCVQFPYFYNDECVNIKYRSGDKRFRQAKNARKTFFNYDMATKSTSGLITIVEGEMDVLTLYEVGLRSVVSVPDGAPTPNAKNFCSKFDFLKGSEELFNNKTEIILAGDMDEAGKKLVDELSRRLGIEKCKVVTWPEGCKDANETFLKHDRYTVLRCIQTAKPFPINSVVSMDDLHDKLVDLKIDPPKSGEEMPWDNTHHLWNVELGQMSFVTGIPSHGKSTWLDALRVGLFRLYGWPSAACSPENWPAENHAQNLLQMYSATNFYQLDFDEFNTYFEETKDAFYFIQPENDEIMLDVDTILNRAKALIFRHGLKVLVIDPWNEIDHVFAKGEREDQYISRQLAKIRRFTRLHKIHTFVVAHPTKLQKDKDGDYPVPTAYDIAGGAMWRNKADNIICVHRPDMTNSETNVYIQKVRFQRNGKVSGLRFNFHVDTSTYNYQGEL